MSQANQQTLESYNSSIAEYFEAASPEVSTAIKEWIDVNLAQLTPGGRILEIGSGTGIDAAYMESQGFVVEMTDASQSFVDRLTSEGRQARMLNALTDDLGSGYDMIYASAVLLHFTRDETAAVLKKMHQALKPSGRLAFSVKSGEGEELTTRKLNAPRYFCYWQQAALEPVVAAAGFTHIDFIFDRSRGVDKDPFLLISAVKETK